MTSTKQINLSAILKEKNVIVKESFKNIKELINFSLLPIYSDISDELVKKMIEDKKELLYMTSIFDNGLIIPHVKIETINEFYASLVVVKKPVFNDDNTKILICFTLISPLNKKFFEKHLEILSKVASVFKNPEEFLSLQPSEIYLKIKQR